MTWTPIERVPEPLHAALCDAVRAAVLGRDVGHGIGRAADGTLTVPLADGMLHVTLRETERTPVRFGPREAIRARFEGGAVAGRVGYGLAATATVDVKTRAFLHVACEILWRDGAAG